MAATPRRERRAGSTSRWCLTLAALMGLAMRRRSRRGCALAHPATRLAAASEPLALGRWRWLLAPRAVRANGAFPDSQGILIAGGASRRDHAGDQLRSGGVLGRRPVLAVVVRADQRHASAISTSTVPRRATACSRLRREADPLRRPALRLAGGDRRWSPHGTHRLLPRPHNPEPRAGGG